MAVVVRLGPLPPGRRRPSRVVELERIFATAIEIVEVFDSTALAAATEMDDVLAVALDASGPEKLAAAVAAQATGPWFVPFGGVGATAEERLTSGSTATRFSPPAASNYWLTGSFWLREPTRCGTDR